MPATKPLPSGFTLAIIGCGKLGTAVLQGILVPLPTAGISNDDHGTESAENNRPTLGRIIVSVRSPEKVQILLEHVLGDLGDRVCPIEFVVGDNVEAARRADAVVLSCHPHQGSEILRVPGMSEALADKLLLSMLGGVSVTTLEDSLYAKSAGAVPSLGRCHIIQAIPNVAAARKKSITVVGDRSACMPDEALELGQEILRRIGDHAFVGTNQMAAATALCASGTAFFSWLVEAMVDAAVAEGIERSEATRMAALTMAGAAELVVSGEDPAVVTARVTTPGGATARGLAVLEHSEVKETVAIALRATTLKIRS